MHLVGGLLSPVHSWPKVDLVEFTFQMYFIHFRCISQRSLWITFFSLHSSKSSAIFFINSLELRRYIQEIGIGNKSVTFQMFLKNAVQAFVIHFWYVGGGVINHVSDTWKQSHKTLLYFMSYPYCIVPFFLHFSTTVMLYKTRLLAYIP